MTTDVEYPSYWAFLAGVLVRRTAPRDRAAAVEGRASDARTSFLDFG